MPPTFPDKYRPHLLAILVAAVFANSFWGVFVFDEYSSITRNDTIRYFWPPDCMFKYPNNTRPVIGLSFAINYFIHGTHHWSYHLFNLAIHLAGTLALYGIALRTFLSDRLKDRYSRDAVRLAFLIALIWAIHPLQTASVTYVVQRCESMMGMFFLLTLYCVIRSDDSRNPGPWILAALGSCVLGMGCKQVMVTVPLIVLIYDRTFLSGSWGGALSRRPLLYLGLCAACLLLIPSMIEKPPGGASAGFGIAAVTPYDYLLTQCNVIPYYLGLTFWPAKLCLDYNWPFTHSLAEALPGAIFLNVLALGTLIGIVRNSPWGFLGAWFFVILAPSSSFMPIQDAIFEHRMYLSLAAVVAAFVIAMNWLARLLIQKGTPSKAAQAAFAGFFLIIVIALGVRTIARNYDYGAESRIWRKVVAQFPESQRATNNLGNALAVEGAVMNDRVAAAKQATYEIPEFVKAVTRFLRIKTPRAKVPLKEIEAMEAAARALHEESVHWFQECARINPNYADAHYNLGVELNVLERKEEAAEHYKRALEIKPDYENAHAYLADILVELHREKEAIPHFEIEIERASKNDNLKERRDELKKKLDEARAKLGSE